MLSLLGYLIFSDHPAEGLNRHYEDIVQSTILDKLVLDDLISRCVITIEDREEILAQISQSERNRLILDILINRPYNTVGIFKEILRNSDPHCRDLLARIEYTGDQEDLSQPQLPAEISNIGICYL